MKKNLRIVLLIGAVVFGMDLPSYAYADSSPIPRLFNVRQGDSVANFARWTGISKRRIRRQLGMKPRDKLKIGVALRLDLTNEQWQGLQKNRGRSVSSGDSNASRLGLSPAPNAENVQIGVGTSASGMIPATTHRVEPGEYGWSIAFRYGISFARLKEANGGRKFGKVRAGRVLNIPERSAQKARRYVVKRPHVIRAEEGETLKLLSEWSGLPVSKIVEINQIKDVSLPIVGKLLKIPVEGVVWEAFQAKRGR